ncbi:MAG: DUF4139 domain-containing protein [Polyangiaceae bacterium]
MALFMMGCGREAIVSTDALPLKKVVLYRNGVGYFERSGHVEDSEVRFKMKETEVGDFLASLAVIERGGSSVRAAAFPLNVDDDNEGDDAPKKKKTDDEKKGLKTVVLSLDGRAHDLNIGYIAESPVWRPSYRLVVQPGGEADLQAWGIVQNLSGEDWKNVRLSLVAGAPLAFEAQLATPVIPTRPIVTDDGEVIAAIPKSETSLRQDPANAPAPKPTGQLKDAESEGDTDGADAPAATAQAFGGLTGTGKGGGGRGAPGNASRSAADKKAAGPMGQAAMPSSAPARMRAPMAPPPPPAPPPMERNISAPRNMRSLAAVAVEGGTTRYDLPVTVTVPDKSATMVMLLSKRVPGEAIFLFAPDGGVPDSMSHPFRVARFSNRTGGVLERGPIAVFESGSFLGQGMVDPLPDGASATVPFALERALAVDKEQKFDELGERIAKIENSELTVERDAVTQTKYRLRNGGELSAKILVKHGRINGTRLFNPPKNTEDNVGSGSALVPATVLPHATNELTVDERATVRRNQDWFSVVADNAVKAYLADPKSDRATVAKLSAAWKIRTEIVTKTEARQKLSLEQQNLSQQTEETRRNLRAIEKNKSAGALQGKLTGRLGEMATRLDDITKQAVEIDSKLAELRVSFKEIIREIKIVDQPTPK